MQHRDVRYGRHTSRRMDLDGITEADLFAIVRTPVQEEIGPDGKSNALRTVNGKLFRAIYDLDKKHPGAVFVITVGPKE